MKHFSNETRQRMSESAKRRCTPEWRHAKSVSYSTPLDTEFIRELYSKGLTQDEIALRRGTSQKVIWKHMKNHGIKARVACKRNQSGESNHMWKGKAAGYQAFHLRVSNAFGKAKDSGCAICGTTSPDISYDWANLTGRYHDITDYLPMCRSCHRKYDKARREGGDLNAVREQVKGI